MVICTSNLCIAMIVDITVVLGPSLAYSITMLNSQTSSNWKQFVSKHCAIKMCKQISMNVEKYTAHCHGVKNESNLSLEIFLSGNSQWLFVLSLSGRSLSLFLVSGSSKHFRNEQMALQQQQQQKTKIKSRTLTCGHHKDLFGKFGYLRAKNGN